MFVLFSIDVSVRFLYTNATGRIVLISRQSRPKSTQRYCFSASFSIVDLFNDNTNPYKYSTRVILLLSSKYDIIVSYVVYI